MDDATAGSVVFDSVDEDRFSPRATRLEDVTRWAIQICVLVLLVMMGVEMIARSAMGLSLQVTNELGGYALIAITFLGLSSGQVGHAFHRMHLLDAHIPVAARAALRLVFDGAAAIVAIVLFLEFTRFTWITWKSGDVAATVLLTPLWIPRAAMPIGALALAITLLRTVVGDFRRLRSVVGGAR